MRPVLCGLAAGLFACHAELARAQQGSLTVTGAAQGVTGDPQRIAGQEAIDPDFGVIWLQPGSRFGTFNIEVRGTRRAELFHVGRTYLSLRDVKYRGLSWMFEGGDAIFTRAIGEYHFSNLTAPAVTFSGGAVSVRGSRGAGQFVAGRGTAWRNIFGTDPDSLAQTLVIGSGTYRASTSLELFGRASKITTSDLKEFTFTIADSGQAGGGVRYTPSPSVQLIADGSVVQFRRVDSDVQERDASALVGAHFLLARGWVQISAARLSPGEFPAMNDPLHDRDTAFAAGEYDVWRRVRLFAGIDAFRTNIDPMAGSGPTATLPQSASVRGFGGVRFEVGPRSTLAVRAESAESNSRPVNGGLDTDNNLQAWSAEWQSAVGAVSMYSRLSHRKNVNPRSIDATYSLNDFSTQLFLRLPRSAQLFGNGTVTRHETGVGTGSSYWQIGGGGQVQLANQPLWLRGEVTTSRNVDLLTGQFLPRESYNIGLNGMIARNVSLSLNVAADRAPLLFGSGTPWTTRSMVRITQTFSTGTARVVMSPGVSAAVARSRGTGSVVGGVFADWNANGTQDADEGPLENIPVRVVGVSAVTTRRDGEFSFVNVPAGVQRVGLDTAAVPVDFDPPALGELEIELDRSSTKRLSFGLIPLGSVRGRVFRDLNGNGRVDPGEEPLDGAVLVLDGGARSEQARKGAYRFDAVRSGDHVVVLVRESLPEGAVVTGVSEVPVSLRRDHLTVEIDFAVAIEKRPETRRVFPTRIGAAPSTTKPRGAPQPQAGKPAAAARPPAATPPPPPSATPPPTAQTPAPATRFGIQLVPPLPPAPGAPAAAAGLYAIQIAALNDPIRAKALVRELIAAGYPAYLVLPGDDDPDGPYRIRVGGDKTRAAATAAAAALERRRREKLWVIREVARK